MIIKEAYFTGSFERENQCPKEIRPEYAFIGRSNVGKSSLVNMLTGRKSLAKVSNTPGKTQTINYYDINGDWYLVDLPGYGYARISQTQRKKWEQMIERYLVTRGQLQCAFVLIDIRHDLQQIDKEFIDWLGERHIPFNIIYTKADKIKATQVEKHVKRIQDSLLETWHSLPKQFITSSAKRGGRDEVLDYIDELNANFGAYD